MAEIQPLPHVTNSAPASRLLALEIYNITPRATPIPDCVEYGVLCNGEFVGSHPDVATAIQYAIEHFNTKQGKLLARVAKPSINIHFSVR